MEPLITSYFDLLHTLKFSKLLLWFFIPLSRELRPTIPLLGLSPLETAVTTGSDSWSWTHYYLFWQCTVRKERTHPQVKSPFHRMDYILHIDCNWDLILHINKQWHFFNCTNKNNAQVEMRHSDIKILLGWNQMHSEGPQAREFCTMDYELKKFC